MWPEKLISVYLPSTTKVVNTAEDGTTWKRILGQWNGAKTQFGKGAKPDILILTTGGNSWNRKDSNFS